MQTPHAGFTARTWTSGPAGLRAVLEAPESGAGAATSPTTTASTVTAATTASKLSAARAQATPQVLPGASARVAQRREASARLDRHNIARTMAAEKAEREASTATAKPADQPVALATVDRPRDASGRFIKPEAIEQPAAETTATTEQAATEQPAKTDAPAIAPEVQARIADLEKRYGDADAKLRQGAQLANERIADITAERDHFKTLFERTRLAIRQLTGGRHDIDPVELQAAELRLQLAKAQRGTQQRQAQDMAQAVSVQSAQIKGRAASLIEKHPELDPKTNPEARSFWEARLMVAEGQPLPPLDTLERDAAAWAMIFRGRQVAAQQQAQASQQQPKVQPKARPAATIPQGQGASQGAGAERSEKRGAHVSNKAIAEHMNQFRAIRGGRA